MQCLKWVTILILGSMMLSACHYPYAELVETIPLPPVDLNILMNSPTPPETETAATKDNEINQLAP